MLLLGAYSPIPGLVLWSAWRSERRARSLGTGRKVTSVRPADGGVDDFTTPVRRPA